MCQDTLLYLGLPGDTTKRSVKPLESSLGASRQEQRPAPCLIRPLTFGFEERQWVHVRPQGTEITRQGEEALSNMTTNVYRNGTKHWPSSPHFVFGYFAEYIPDFSPHVTSRDR
jgi:hypothetical protein